MRSSRWIWILGMGGAVLCTKAVLNTSIIKTVIAVAAAAAMLRLGWMMIGGLAAPVPEPPEPGSLRKVKLVFRCPSCGAEVKMTAAASEDPEPPRHCMDDMELVTSLE